MAVGPEVDDSVRSALAATHRGAEDHLLGVERQSVSADWLVVHPVALYRFIVLVEPVPERRLGGCDRRLVGGGPLGEQLIAARGSTQELADRNIVGSFTCWGRQSRLDLMNLSNR